MTSKIRLLDEQTVNQIAAGEVIENPSSVVKELIENSLDAGATAICVEIQQGGRELIRITDNGCGMSDDDAILCLERHATSKIKQVEDIQELITMGFRGEAIPSIASISKFTLLTCLKGSEKGFLIKMEGGKLLFTGAAARSPGTTIEVKSLFFNVPVRRKFQKSPGYDIQAILKIVSLLALGYPHIQFELISDQKILLKTPLASSSDSFSGHLKNRIEIVLGKEFTQGLAVTHLAKSPFEIEGFIGLPEHHKPNKSGQYLFINNRVVQSSLVSSAIREGFGTMLPTQRFPVFVLHLKLPGSLVDVNVHPQKKEVRLRQEYALKEFLMHAVQKSLQKKPSFIPPTNETFSVPFYSKKSEPLQVCEDKWEYRPVEEMDFSNALTIRSNDSVQENEYIHPLFTVPETTPKVLYTISGYFVLDSCNAKLSSLVGNSTGGFCVVSQKNAYARIFYERLLQITPSPDQIQTLLVPITLNFSAIEAHLVKEYLPEINQLGFLIREFGNHSFLLEGYPPFLEKQNITECIYEMIKELLDQQGAKRLEQKKKEQLAWLACKSSFRSNKRLSIQEAQVLMDELFACSLPFQCPLGKATIVYWSCDEMGKFFN